VDIDQQISPLHDHSDQVMGYKMGKRLIAALAAIYGHV
jgi:hypothetical protein